MPVVPTFVTADIHFLRSLAVSGQGTALVPEGAMPEVDASARLLPVLETLVGREESFKALVPGALAPLPSGQRLLDFLRELTLLMGG